MVNFLKLCEIHEFVKFSLRCNFAFIQYMGGGVMRLVSLKCGKR